MAAAGSGSGSRSSRAFSLDLVGDQFGEEGYVAQSVSGKGPFFETHNGRSVAAAGTVLNGISSFRFRALSGVVVRKSDPVKPPPRPHLLSLIMDL
jgi:hypothetical protein